MKRLMVICLLLLTLPAALHAQEARLKIVATTTQAADIARILTDGIDGIEISALMSAGVDPHLYKPTESDIAAMNAADAVFYSGLHLEGQFDAVFEALGERGVTIVALGEPVKDAGYTIGGFTLSEELTDVDDPHFWFDPRNWAIAVDELATVLVTLLPDDADTIMANAQAYQGQLETLFAWADAAMRTVPEDQRVLVTSHDAFQYFGAAFGWQVEAIQGISTADEAGVGDVQNVVDFVLDNAIPVMFVESSVSPATIEAVREGVEDAGGAVRLGVRGLYSDAMDAPDTFGGTYVGMLASNVYIILTSYACTGIDLAIPAWDESLTITPPTELIAPECVGA
ncbi:MAG: zinc ABC transporter substrate-binding protein [Chloroflexota bacterium]|nr:zinc ABC transporter substrate-binding protein [Chloroflexota bacterium]